MDLGGFDSSLILDLRGGIPRPIGIFPESLTQAILVGVMLVGIYTYIYIYIYIYTCFSLSLYIYIYIYICIHIYTHSYIHLSLSLYIYIYIYAGGHSLFLIRSEGVTEPIVTLIGAEESGRAEVWSSPFVRCSDSIF